MNKFSILLIGFIGFLILAESCSSPQEPSFLNGRYEGFVYERVNCLTNDLNIRVNLLKDSTYQVNCDTTFFDCDSIIQSEIIVSNCDTIFMGDDTTFVNCDTMINILNLEVVNCSFDLFNCDSVVYNSVTFSIDSIARRYTLEEDRVFNGVQENIITEGAFISNGFNDFNICVNNCTDSSFFYGVYVLDGDELNISWQDTIVSGCGFLFQGNRTN